MENKQVWEKRHLVKRFCLQVEQKANRGKGWEGGGEKETIQDSNDTGKKVLVMHDAIANAVWI